MKLCVCRCFDLISSNVSGKLNLSVQIKLISFWNDLGVRLPLNEFTAACNDRCSCWISLTSKPDTSAAKFCESWFINGSERYLETTNIRCTPQFDFLRSVWVNLILRETCGALVLGHD